MSICCTGPVEYSISMDKCARIGGAFYPWMASTIDEFLPTSTAQTRPKHGRSGRFDKMWGFQHRKTFCQFSLNCPFPHAL